MKINKYILLLLLIIGCLLIGNLITIAISYLTNISIDIISLREPTENNQILKIIKAIIGINHIVGFTFSSFIFVHFYKKKEFAPYFNLDKVPLFDIISICILAIMVSYPLVGFTSQLGDWLTLPEWAKSLDENSFQQLYQILKMETPLDFAINLLIIAIIPGIGEELLFRGIIQKEIQISWKHNHMAIWITAIIFSAFHLQIEGFLPKFILGLIFGYAYYYTKNLWYPIILHILNNGMQVIMVYIAGEQFEELSKQENAPIHWSVGLISLLLILAVWYYIDRNDKSLPLTEEHQEHEKLLD